MEVDKMDGVSVKKCIVVLTKKILNSIYWSKDKPIGRSSKGRVILIFIFRKSPEYSEVYSPEVE